jgi:hypothetical protein
MELSTKRRPPALLGAIHPFWWSGAVLFASLAFLASPRFLPPLPPQADALLDLLNAGLRWARFLFVAAAVLAVASGWMLRTTDGADARAAQRSDRLPLLAMAGLFLLALLLRLPNAAESMWWDELNSTIRVVLRGVPVIVAFNADGNNHFLNSLLMFVSYKVFGAHDWAFRLPSLLLGSAFPPVAFWAWRRITGYPIALVTAVLVAVHFRAVAFSDEARGYTGAMLFGMLASAAWITLWRRFSVPSAVLYLLAVIVSSAFIATGMYLPMWHSIAVFLCAAAWRWRSRAAVAAYLPLLITTIWGSVLAVMTNILVMPQLISYADNRAGQAHVPMSWNLLWATLHFITGVDPMALAAVALATSGAGWYLLNREHGKQNDLLYGLAGPPLFQLLAFTVQRTQSSPRLYVLLVFPFVVGVASVLVWLWSRQRVAAVILGGVLMAGAVPAFQRFYGVGNPDLRGLAARLSTHDVLLAGEQGDMNVYYFPGALWTLQENTAAMLGSAPPNIHYALIGEDCGHERYPDDAVRLGFVRRQRLEDWTAREYSPTQRRPCFVLYERASTRAAQ